MTRTTLKHTVCLALVVLLCTCQCQERVTDPTTAAWTRLDTPAPALIGPGPQPSFLPITHFSAGQILEQRGQFARAIDQYRKAVALNHDFIAAYNRLGLLLCRIGQPQQAEAAFREALGKRPDRAYLQNNLAFSLMLQQEWAAAESQLVEALQLKSTFRRARINLGICLGKQGHYEEAMAQFSEALPTAEAFFNLGLLYKSNKEYEEAASAFRQALQEDPSFVAAARHLEVITAEQRRRALTALQQAYEDPAQDQLVRAYSDAQADTPVSPSEEANLAPQVPPETTLAEALPELQPAQTDETEPETAVEFAANAPTPTEERSEPELISDDIEDLELATADQVVETAEATDDVNHEPSEPTVENAVAIFPIGHEPLLEFDVFGEITATTAGPPMTFLLAEQPVDQELMSFEDFAADPVPLIAETSESGLAKLINWLRAFLGFASRPTQDPPVTETAQCPLPLNELTTLQTPAGPWWFDYPDAWEAAFDWTWLALQPPEPPVDELTHPDWWSEFQQAVMDPASDDLPAAWLLAAQQ